MRKISRARAGLLSVLAAGALLGSACTPTTSESPAPSSTEQPAITGEPAAFTAADETFAEGLLMRHRQSIELSALVPEHSTDPALVALAADISAAQHPEMEMARVFLVQWGENPNADIGQLGTGMVDDATMARLESLTGAEFGALWLSSMIGINRGAIDIAEAETADGTNVDAVAFAQQVVDSQRVWVGQMEQMLAGA